MVGKVCVLVVVVHGVCNRLAWCCVGGNCCVFVFLLGVCRCCDGCHICAVCVACNLDDASKSVEGPLVEDQIPCEIFCV